MQISGILGLPLILAFAGLIYYFVRRRISFPALIGLDNFSINVAGIGACLAFAGIGCAIAYSAIQIFSPIIESALYKGVISLRYTPTGPQTIATFATLAAGTIFTLLINEMLLRGILYNWLKAYWGWLLAAFVTSLAPLLIFPFLFAKVDVPQAHYGLWGGVALALFGGGFGLCWLNERFGRGSILPSWLALVFVAVLEHIIGRVIAHHGILGAVTP